MKALIDYSIIENIPVGAAIDIIAKSDKITYGKATLSDLLISGDITSLPLCGYNSVDNFGRGIYVFFDVANAVYVGKADNFLNRLSGHADTVSRPGWGWNALLQIICRKRLFLTNDPLTNDDLNKALQQLNTYSFVRVNIGNNMSLNPQKIERIFLRGFKKRYPDTLMNGGVGGIDPDYMNRSVRIILNERP